MHSAWSFACLSVFRGLNRSFCQKCLNFADYVSLDQAPQWGKRRKKKKNGLASLADFMFSYRCFNPFFCLFNLLLTTDCDLQGINQSQQSFASLNDKMNENTIADSLVLPEVSASFEESFF